MVEASRFLCTRAMERRRSALPTWASVHMLMPYRFLRCHVRAWVLCPSLARTLPSSTEEVTKHHGLSLDHSSSFRRDDPASLVGLTESITAPRVQCGREASPCLGSSLDVTPCRIASGSGAGTHLAMGTRRVGV